MKKISFTLSVLLAVGNLFSQALIVDFDKITSQIGGWEGVAAIVDNPKNDGINTSAKVGKYTTPAGKAWANAGTVLFTDTIDYKLLDSIQFMVKAPSASKMYVKLEDGAKVHKQPDAYFTPQGTLDWQVVTLKFSGVSGADSISARYDKLVIFFNVDDNTGGEDWFFDNVVVYPDTAAPTANGDPDPPLGSHKKVLDFDTIPYTIGGWVGTGSTAVNPKKSGINVSDSVGSYLTPANAANAHAAWVLFKDTINYELLDSVTFQVLAPSATNFYAKLEDHAKNNPEAIAYGKATSSTEWQEITLKFSGVSGNDSLYSRYDKITFTFNNADATGGETWLFDNVVVYPEKATFPVVKVKPGTPGDQVLLSDWDSLMPAWYYNDTQNADLYQINENKGVGNSKCGMFTTNASKWNLIMFNYDKGFNWEETGNKFTFKVKAPILGKVSLKFENGEDKNINMGGDEIALTKKDEYEEINFDFDAKVAGWKALNKGSDINEAFTRMVIFFDISSELEGNQWFIDDIYVPEKLVSASYLGSIIVENTSTRNAEFNSVNIYPNPVKDLLTISQNDNIQILEIFNNGGVLVAKEQITNATQQINVAKLPQGIYMVKLTNGKGEFKAYTIIK